MMNNTFFPTGIIVLTTVTLLCCGKKETTQEKAPTFSKVDSLTDRYLDLHDSIMITWNIMIQDDNQKIRAMKSLIHELSIAGQVNQEELLSLDHRLQQLEEMRYTPETINEPDIIEEYDFASNSLVNELSVITKSHPAFAHNKVLRQLIDHIHSADQRVSNYREEYDAIVNQYNHFIENNSSIVQEVGNDLSLSKKPMFQMTAESN